MTPTQQARQLEKEASEHQRQGRYADAEAPLLAAIAIWAGLRGPDDIEVLNDQMNLGISYRRRGEAARAIPLLESVARRLRTCTDRDAPDLWRKSMSGVAVAYREVGQVQAARAALDACLASFGEGASDDKARILDNMSALLADHDPFMAETYARHAHADWVALRGPNDLDAAVSAIAIGIALMRQDRLAEAAPLFVAAEPTLRALGDHPRVGELDSLLGELAARTKEPARARHHTEAALAMFRKFFPDEHPDVQTALRNLAAIAP